MHNIILLGPPGSGKGTQAKYLIQKHGFLSIALGELLRKQIEEESIHKKVIEQYVHDGHLVPDSLSCKLVADLLQTHLPTQSVLFDGFPRTLKQAVFLSDFLAAYHVGIDAVLFLDVQEPHLIKRLQARAMKENRSDDQDEEKIQTRMQTYRKETAPLINYYQEQGKLYCLDGNQSTEQIMQTIEGVIANL